jgi:hypothetical protein
MNETRIESLRFSPIENTSTGTIAVLSTHDTSMYFFTGAGAVTVESISYGSKGKVLKLANITGNILTLKYNTGSINKNKIITTDSNDLIIQNNQIINLMYDHINSRWKLDGLTSTNTPITVTGTGTQAANLLLSSIFIVEPTGNITVNMSNPTPGFTYAFTMKQGVTPYTIGFTQTIKWKGGSAYTATNSVNAIDIVTLFYDGTNYYGTYGLAYA